MQTVIVIYRKTKCTNDSLCLLRCSITNLIQICCDEFDIVKQIHLLLWQDQGLQPAHGVCLEWPNYLNVAGFA